MYLNSTIIHDSLSGDDKWKPLTEEIVSSSIDPSHLRTVNEYCNWLHDRQGKFKIALTERFDLLVWSNISKVLQLQTPEPVTPKKSGIKRRSSLR